MQDGADAASQPTPIPITSRGRMLLVVAVLAAAVVLLWLAPAARTMVVGGFTLAMYLSVLVNTLRRWMGRGVAVAVVFLGLIEVVLLALVTHVPALIDQLRGANADLTASQPSIRNALAKLMQPLTDRGIIDASADEVAERLSTGITTNLADI